MPGEISHAAQRRLIDAQQSDRVAGVFTCGRCGANMVGFMREKDKHYYVCSSVPKRRGLGCGAGVYVPKADVEQAVIHRLRELIGACADRDGFVRKVNEELRGIWEASHGYDPAVEHRLAEIEAKIANIRKAIEDGCPDMTWAYKRMSELMAEREGLASTPTQTGRAPRIDPETAMAYRLETEKVLAHGDAADRKRVLSPWVREIKLAPESLKVEINFQIPEPVVDSMGAGTLSVANYNALASLFTMSLGLSRKGRRVA